VRTCNGPQESEREGYTRGEREARLQICAGAEEAWGFCALENRERRMHMLRNGENKAMRARDWCLSNIFQM